MIKEILEAKREGHISSGKFSVSGIGGCKRKIYMKMKGLYKEEYSAQTLRIFDIGTLFHQQAVKEMYEKCNQFGMDVVAAEINIPKHKYFAGRADIIMSVQETGEKIIIDVKSAANYTLQLAKKGEVSEAYINQVQLYLHFFGIKRGFLLFFGKAKGDIEEFEILYDKELCEKLVRDVEIFFEENIAKDIPPEKCDGKPFGCSCCFPPISEEELKKLNGDTDVNS